ncbi:MAG: type II secretion system F family protein [Friedmanniella sp.]
MAVTLLAAAMALLTWTILSRPPVDKAALANLRRGLTAQDAVQDSGPGAAPWFGQLAVRLVPPGRQRVLERLWTRAGRPQSWPVPRLVLAKLVLPLIAAVLTLFYLTVKPGTLTLAVGVVVVIVCHFLPELLLHSRAQERSQKMTLELADTLDQMTIAVEAGLGFDGAMAKAGQNGKGPLAEELVRTLQDIQLGHSRREAYESLANRTDVVDLRRFVRAVVQADRYGVAVADVLRTQAAEMRLKRRQRAEEKAMQIPVKVIFPLMLCILPVLFIVLLGPAAMDIVGAFS